MSTAVAVFPTKGLPEKPLDNHDLAEMFNVSLLTIDRWVKRGQLPQPAVLGSRRFWSREAIDKLLAK